ncbi:MAG TPA: hypothetical protein VIZ65_05730 [Cellvibrionaceae bacterium]
MKTYQNGVIGPDLEQCDIITFDLKDAALQFCLPASSEDFDCRLATQESIDNWQSMIDFKILVQNWWDYNKRDENGEWNVGSVLMDMKLINLDRDDLESWLGVKPYCLLKKDDLSRLAIEYFIRSAVDMSRVLNPDISETEALKEYRIFTKPEDLLLSKQDLLPWYTNKRNLLDCSSRWLSHTFIPISERAAIFLQFDLTPQTSNDKPFFFSKDDGQKFGDILRDEFLNYVKITYSPEIQEKIKQYAQQP